MVCIKSHISVQVTLEGDQLESFGFVSVVNSRIASELSGIKFELKIENKTFYYQAIECCLDTCFFPSLFSFCIRKNWMSGREQGY